HVLSPLVTSFRSAHPDPRAPGSARRRAATPSTPHRTSRLSAGPQPGPRPRWRRCRAGTTGFALATATKPCARPAPPCSSACPRRVPACGAVGVIGVIAGPQQCYVLRRRPDGVSLGHQLGEDLLPRAALG